MRRHVAGVALAQAAGGIALVHVAGSTGVLALGGHGVLEGTLGGPMVAGTDTTLDLGVLQVGLLLLMFALVVGRGLPVGRGAEDNVLGNTGGVGLGADRLSLLLAEFCPLLALGDAGVHDLLDDRLLDAAGGLDLLAIFADRVGDDGLGAVLVLDDLGRGKGEGIELVILLSPVGTSALRQLRKASGVGGGLTLRLLTLWRCGFGWLLLGAILSLCGVWRCGGLGVARE